MHGQNAKTLRLVALLLMAIACIGCDQVTKQIATERLENAAPISLLGDTLRLQYAENPGGFLGLGRQLTPSARFAFLVVFNAAILGGVCWALIGPAKLNHATATALALILAGGIGNLIDRIGNNGLVTDFLNLGIGPVRTGIFNVADVAISIGCVLLSLTLFKKTDAGTASGQLAR